MKSAELCKVSKAADRSKRPLIPSIIPLVCAHWPWKDGLRMTEEKLKCGYVADQSK